MRLSVILDQNFLPVSFGIIPEAAVQITIRMDIRVHLVLAMDGGHARVSRLIVDATSLMVAFNVMDLRLNWHMIIMDPMPAGGQLAP